MTVTTYYLEMKSPEQLNEKTQANGLDIVEAKIDEFKIVRKKYLLYD